MAKETTAQLDRIADILRSSNKVLVLTGAGISAESGVPTFRGGGGALVWKGMPFEVLSSAEMVRKDLPLVWQWFDYRREKVLNCKPNTAHIALANAQRSGRFENFTLVTQNIDGLHAIAGSDELIELHGNIHFARCISCHSVRRIDEFEADDRPPKCGQCKSKMRPNVVLFGEAMPMEKVIRASDAATECEVCIVIGTSAIVYPAAELPLIAKRQGKIVIEINPEETALTPAADHSIRSTACGSVPVLFADKPTESSGKFRNV